MRADGALNALDLFPQDQRPRSLHIDSEDGNAEQDKPSCPRQARYQGRGDLGAGRELDRAGRVGGSRCVALNAHDEDIVAEMPSSRVEGDGDAKEGDAVSDPRFLGQSQSELRGEEEGGDEGERGLYTGSC